MMTPDDNRLVGHDDGFRVSDEAVERAVAHVMSVPQESHVFRLHSVWPIAAAIALVLGMGVFLSDAIKPEPCVTFACQIEALSDEEFVAMMDLMEEDVLIKLDEESWPTLY